MATLTDEEKVTAYMKELEHPLKKEVEALRKIIKANKKISERIKWNAPSYYYKADIVTFNLRERKKVMLVFHHLTVVKIKSTLLTGDYKDRRLMLLNDMKAVKSCKTELEGIMEQLIKFQDKG